MSEQVKQEIDVTQAVRIAKEYVAKAFAEDHITPEDGPLFAAAWNRKRSAINFAHLRFEVR